MTNYEKIRAMSVEEMAVLINGAEELLQLPPCSKEHCEVWREDGRCKSAFKEPCVAATVHWLNSEAEDDTSSVTAHAVPPSPQGEGLTVGQKDALLRTFLGRGGERDGEE